MAFGNGPRIVTDGLVLSLDAADRNSYPGSGTTWKDLSGNNYNGTLTNGPTFSNNTITFDGTNDTFLFNNTTTFITNSPWTYLCWVNLNTVSIHCHITGVPNTDPGGWAPLSHYGAGRIAGKQSWWDSNGWRESTTSINENTWYHLGLTYDGNNTITFIYNDRYDNSTTGSTTFNPIARLGALGYRQHLNDRYMNGNLSTSQLYTRTLSVAEIQQNYNAQKSRFGL